MAHSQKIIKVKQDLLKQFLALKKPCSSSQICSSCDCQRQVIGLMNLGLNEYLIQAGFSMRKEYGVPLEVYGTKRI